MKNIILWAFILLAGTFSQLLFKMGLKKNNIIQWNNVSSVIKFYLNNINIYFISGFFLAAISFLVWLKILSTHRVSIAFNISALMYIIMPAQAYLFLGEPIGI